VNDNGNGARRGRVGFPHTKRKRRRATENGQKRGEKKNISKIVRPISDTKGVGEKPQQGGPIRHVSRTGWAWLKGPQDWGRSPGEGRAKKQEYWGKRRNVVGGEAAGGKGEAGPHKKFWFSQGKNEDKRDGPDRSVEKMSVVQSEVRVSQGAVWGCQKPPDSATSGRGGEAGRSLVLLIKSTGPGCTPAGK